MINDKVLLGYPLEFNNICKVYPPLVKDAVGNDDFYLYSSALTKSQEEVEDIFVEKKQIPEKFPTPLEFILGNCYYNDEFAEQMSKAFAFFIKEPVTFLYEEKSILIGDLEEELLRIKDISELRLITENNFFEFQNLIRQLMGLRPVDPPNPDEDPRVKRIKAKARYRDKIKAKKGMGISMGTNLAAICCMQIGINPLNIGELSYAAIRYLTEMYQNKETYENDVNSILAGGDPKKIKLTYWIRNLE